VVHCSQTSNSEISEALGIPRSTVSRIVGEFIESKVVVEQPDPDDGRCRLLKIAGDNPTVGKFEYEVFSLLQKYFL
jgi:hypothetical protein